MKKISGTILLAAAFCLIFVRRARNKSIGRAVERYIERIWYALCKRYG